MSDSELVHVVDPQALERARRLAFAIKLVEQGELTMREVSARLQERFGCSQPTAWRTVDMANDLAGKVSK
jgi:hypothetical protein